SVGFSLSSSPASRYVLRPKRAPAEGTVCSVTVRAKRIHDVDRDDPPDTMARDFKETLRVPAANAPPPTTTTTTPTTTTGPPTAPATSTSAGIDVGAPPDQTPTGIALCAASVAENQPAGTAVGTLSATDPDAGDTLTFSLVAGAGSTDNGSFQISGKLLQTAAVFDFETKSAYSIRVRV